MKKIEWVRTFELGVPEIDGDHRTIVELMNAIVRTAGSRNRNSLNPLLDRLVAFAERHFENEESFLRRMGYPSVDMHASYHADLLERINELEAKYSEINSELEIDEILQQLMQYIIDDIVRGDTKVLSHLQENNVVLTYRSESENESETKSMALAVLSHEIRTSLNGITGAFDNLLNSQLDRSQEKLVRIGKQACDALMGMLNDTLEYSKMVSGHLKFESVEFDFRKLLDDIHGFFSNGVGPKPIALTCEVSPDVPTWLRADPMRLRQVLLNLVGNALKFTRDGHVHVYVSLLSVAEHVAEIRIEVKDTGIGISRDAQANLFQAFSQADASITREFGGTGLGLAISKIIVDGMGGAIGVDSELGEGSKFWFTFRSHVAETPATDLHIDAKNRPHTERLQILLADDNEHCRAVVSMTLQSAGHDVDVVANGLEAVAAARARIYDAILLDLNMPELDGLGAANEIRSFSAHEAASVPMVAVTASDLSGGNAALIGSLFDGHVCKPISPGALIAAIRDVVYSRS